MIRSFVPSASIFGIANSEYSVIFDILIKILEGLLTSEPNKIIVKFLGDPYF